MNYALVIPSLNPGQELILLVDELTRRGEKLIILINDGSDAAHVHIFQHLRNYENVVLLEHEVNRGKGAALKTAFAYCVKSCPDIVGVVTADSDGQHTPEDIQRIGTALAQNPHSLILGVREFDKATTPAKSYVGNRAISAAFKLLYGVSISDTQTGLRGIPLADLGWMSAMRGDRYEYEMNMLIQARRRRLEMVQIPIVTLYFNNNKGTHFKAVRDTLRIIKLLVRNIVSRAHKAAKPYGKLFYFSRGFLRLSNPKLTVEGEIPSRPVVFIGHHQNLKGALNVMTWLKTPVRLWMLDVFCDQESCYNQYANYTFTERMGMFKPIAHIASFIASRFVPRLAKSMRAIPVYRNSQKALSITFEQSVDALCNNENILLFPDVDYSSESDNMGNMYTGFIHLDKYYYARTRRHLAFVPIQVNADQGRLRIGNPSGVQEGERFAQAKKRVSAELHEKLNTVYTT